MSGKGPGKDPLKGPWGRRDRHSGGARDGRPGRPPGGGELVDMARRFLEEQRGSGGSEDGQSGNIRNLSLERRRRQGNSRLAKSRAGRMARPAARFGLATLKRAARRPAATAMIALGLLCGWQIHAATDVTDWGTEIVTRIAGAPETFCDDRAFEAVLDDATLDDAGQFRAIQDISREIAWHCPAAERSEAATLLMITALGTDADQSLSDARRVARLFGTLDAPSERFEAWDKRHIDILVEALGRDPVIRAGMRDWRDLDIDARLAVAQRAIRHQMDVYGVRMPTIGTFLEKPDGGRVKNAIYMPLLQHIEMNVHPGPGDVSFARWLESALHEGRHHIQKQAALMGRRDQLAYDHPVAELAPRWMANVAAYMPADEDRCLITCMRSFRDYRDQPVEADAFSFAGEVTGRVLKRLRDDAGGPLRYTPGTLTDPATPKVS